MATDYIDSKGLYHLKDNGHQIVTTDKEYVEQVLGRKFNLREQFLGGKEMGIRETIALIGSMSETNKAAMMALFNRLTWKGSIVHLPYMERVIEDASDEQIKTLHKLHEYKMSEANLIIVVDADGHIGKDTQREIDWCIYHGRNIIYLSDMQVYDEEAKQTKGGKK